MTWLGAFDQRPALFAIAGPNGAGMTTFFDTYIKETGLRFVNADLLASQFDLGIHDAAKVADVLRRTLIAQRESFVFETVFSDPVGQKVALLEDAVSCGYTVVLCFVGLENTEQSVARVAVRVSQGGHDVPTEKLQSRFPRSLANLKLSINRLPNVLVFDNSNLANPFRLAAVFRHGELLESHPPIPCWMIPMYSQS